MGFPALRLFPESTAAGGGMDMVMPSATVVGERALPACRRDRWDDDEEEEGLPLLSSDPDDDEADVDEVGGVRGRLLEGPLDFMIRLVRPQSSWLGREISWS
jgi:hypothetical protein